MKRNTVPSQETSPLMTPQHREGEKRTMKFVGAHTGEITLVEDLSKEELFEEYRLLVEWLGNNHREVFDEYFE